MNFTLKKPIRWFWNHKNNYVAHSLGLGVPSTTIPDFSFVTDVLYQGEIDDCTANNACATRQSMKGTAYDPLQYWQAELAFLNNPKADGCDMKTQMAVGVKVGFVPLQRTIPQDTCSAYFQVVPNNGLDMFDAIISTMYQNNVPAPVGLPWYSSWNGGNSGTVPFSSVSLLGGHSVKIAGKKTVNGVEKLIVQNSWGVNAPGSDNGLYYFDRITVNQYFNTYGCYIWSDSQNTEIKTLGLIQALYQNIIDILGSVAVYLQK